MAKVLVIGSGAREHVIIETLLKSDCVKMVYALKGNSGMLGNSTGPYDRCILVEDVDDEDHEEVCQFCLGNVIDLVVIGPEKPLVEGLVDKLELEGVKCFGPTRLNAILTEGSKVKSKIMMQELGLPTSPFKVFELRDRNGLVENWQLKLVEYVCSLGDDIDKYVIKKDGLAAGKGVYLPNGQSDAILFIQEECCNDEECDRLIIEERLEGIEVSVMGFCNGKDIWLMPQSQDYKKIDDQDIGLNTGGMGAVCPVQVLNDIELKEVREYMKKVVVKCGEESENRSSAHLRKGYVGILYGGLMKCSDGYYFLEFNARFGDPEAQAVLNLLSDDTPLYDICLACVEGRDQDVKWKKGHVANVVMSHVDYPVSRSREPLDVMIYDKFHEYGNKIYWANIKNEYGVNYTTGGRVCSVVRYSEKSLYDALQNIYNSTHHIVYRGQYYRRDIGTGILFDQPVLGDNGGKKIKIAILGSTRGTSTTSLFELIKKEALNARVEVVISNKKNSGILDKARDFGIPFVYMPFFKKRGETRESYDRKLVELLNIYDVDIVLLVGYMRIVTSELIDAYRGRIFNIHPSLLPKHTGGMDMEVHQRVLDWGEPFTGCTLHHVTEEVDGGKFVMQKQLRVDPEIHTDAERLKVDVQNLEKMCLIEFVRWCSNGQFNLLEGGYSGAGVDIDKGNKFVDLIKGLSDSCEKEIGGFCSVFHFTDDLYIGMCTDGVGTKLEIAREHNKYDGLGIDLVAMSVNDLIARGVYPTYFLDYLAVNKLDLEVNYKLLKSIHEGCKIAGCKLVGGETAEMGNVYRVGGFDLAGFAVGGAQYCELLPKKIGIGDKIYGLPSSGLHSNGFSLVRKVLKHSEYDIDEILKPTRIYTDVLKMICLVNMSCSTKGVVGAAHITGGGLNQNVDRNLQKGLKSKINEDAWEVPDVFRWVQRESGISEKELRRTFNCGIGMVLIISKDCEYDLSEFDELIEIGEVVEG